jgi:hypothetical protein
MVTGSPNRPRSNVRLDCCHEGLERLVGCADPMACSQDILWISVLHSGYS